MAKRAGAGELRTRIRVMERPIGADDTPELDADGYPAEAVNVFGPGAVRHCKWVPAWGNEIYAAAQAGVSASATLTMRYSPKITTTCIIYRERDRAPWEVLSVCDVDDRHAWLEVKVGRREGAR
ncbi:MAG: head-tail adaptor protein [Clostridiales bacterium]|nr:head-tail adaptor protein [Clostridiales bacterium]MDY4180984.1 head-tail adaptor protein [Pseudoflavonifractor sp.]